MKLKGPDHPNYEYYQSRLAKCEAEKQKLYDMTGKNIPIGRPRRKKPLT